MCCVVFQGKKERDGIKASDWRRVKPSQEKAKRLERNTLQASHFYVKQIKSKWLAFSFSLLSSLLLLLHLFSQQTMLVSLLIDLMITFDWRIDSLVWRKTDWLIVHWRWSVWSVDWLRERSVVWLDGWAIVEKVWKFDFKDSSIRLKMHSLDLDMAHQERRDESICISTRLVKSGPRAAVLIGLLITD